MRMRCAGHLLQYPANLKQTRLVSLCIEKQSMDTKVKSKQSMDTKVKSKQSMDTMVMSKQSMDTKVKSKQSMDTRVMSKQSMDTRVKSKQSMDTKVMSKQSMYTKVKSNVVLRTTQTIKCQVHALCCLLLYLLPVRLAEISSTQPHVRVSPVHKHW